MVRTSADEGGWIYWTRMMKMKLPGRRKGERPQGMSMDVVKEELKRTGVKEEDEYMKDWKNGAKNAQHLRFHFCNTAIRKLSYQTIKKASHYSLRI